jgi:membrane peptidoglycan carboxypeptidase
MVGVLTIYNWHKLWCNKDIEEFIKQSYLMNFLFQILPPSPIANSLFTCIPVSLYTFPMQKFLPILRARRERRLAGQRAAANRTRGFVMTAGMVISVLLGALILMIAFAYADVTRDLPSVEILPRLFNPPDGILLEPTRMYDRTGTQLIYTFSPTDMPRRYIPVNAQNPQHIPFDMVNSIVAVQDPQFWNHSGYSLQGYNDPNAHPTIAQKLIYDFILYKEEPSLRRAIRERILAAQITSQFGREQVMEWYLNSTHFGNYAYGVDAAAQLYFGKPASNLTLAESVILAATSETPALNPLDAEQVALQRGREVIYVLNELGMISSERAAIALIEVPKIQPAPPPPFDYAPAFRNLVISQLESQIPRDRIERGGLKIVTTLNYDLQRESKCVTEVYAARIAELGAPKDECTSARLLPALPPSTALTDSSASAAILDPNTGQILALVGETKRGAETPLVGEHPAGSSLDAFVYLTGFTRGLSPASLTWDIPNDSNIQNFDGKFHGPLRLRVALANDYQLPLENLKAQMGIENVTNIESSFGIENQNVSMLKLAGAYGVFAKQGIYLGRELRNEFVPTAVLRVEDLNHSTILDWSLPQSKPILPASLAYLMTHVLSDASIRNDATSFDIGRPAGMKVGQTADGRDAWVVGYTPAHTVVTWTGARDEGANITPRVPAVLWNALMKAAAGNSPADSWTAPQGVSTITVCDPSGMLPTRECPRLVNEVFLNGNEPVQADNLYREFDINRETNLLATVFTPPELIEKRVYLIVPDNARSWAMNAGLAVPPAAYDAIQPPMNNPTVNITAPALFSDVTEVVKIIGTASGENFQYYRVQVGQGLNPQQWIQVGSDSIAPVENGVLAEWDTKGLSGLYAVRLLVVREDQRVETAVIQVTIK